MGCTGPYYRQNSSATSAYGRDRNPIIGDGKYGGSSQENLGDGWGAQFGDDISKKLHLHARYLKIEHPFEKKLLK